MDTYNRLIRRWLPEVEFHQNRYARELDRAVRPGTRWLDLGAGTRVHSGWIGVPQEALCRRAQILAGCDIVQDHLRRNPMLSAAIVASGEQLPFRDGSFDLVTANMVLEHLQHPATVFAEVFRVLVPGGRFAFVTPNLNHPAVRLLAMFMAPRWRRLLAFTLEHRKLEHIFLTHYRANTPRVLEQLARSIGFESPVLEPFSSYPMIRSPAVLTLAECGLIRLMMTRPGRQFRSNLIGVLEKPAPGSGSSVER